MLACGQHVEWPGRLPGRDALPAPTSPPFPLLRSFRSLERTVARDRDVNSPGGRLRNQWTAIAVAVTACLRSARGAHGRRRGRRRSQARHAANVRGQASPRCAAAPASPPGSDFCALSLPLVVSERHLVHRVDETVNHGLVALDVTRHARPAVNGRAVETPEFLEVVPDNDCDKRGAWRSLVEVGGRPVLPPLRLAKAWPTAAISPHTLTRLPTYTLAWSAVMVGGSAASAVNVAASPTPARTAIISTSAHDRSPIPRRNLLSSRMSHRAGLSGDLAVVGKCWKGLFINLPRAVFRAPV